MLISATSSIFEVLHSTTKQWWILRKECHMKMTSFKLVYNLIMLSTQNTNGNRGLKCLTRWGLRRWDYFLLEKIVQGNIAILNQLWSQPNNTLLNSMTKMASRVRRTPKSRMAHNNSKNWPTERCTYSGAHYTKHTSEMDSYKTTNKSCKKSRQKRCTEVCSLMEWCCFLPC